MNMNNSGHSAPARGGDADWRIIRALVALALAAGFVWIVWRAFDGLDEVTKAFMAGALFGGVVVGFPSWLALFYLRARYHDEADGLREQADHARQQALNMQAYMLQQAAGSRLLEAQMAQMAGRWTQPGIAQAMPPALWQTGYDSGCSAGGDDLAEWPAEGEQA